MNISLQRRVSKSTRIGLTVASILAAAATQARPAPTPMPAPVPVMTLQEVIVTGKELQLKSLKQKSIYESAYGDKALDRQQLKSAGVVGGAAAALSFAPGVTISGYGQTGGTKATISINGISQGWTGVSPGSVDNGSLAVSFDGIPMSNAITGLWETPEIPQTALLQGARITYGPGDAENRWYNNIGGAVNFVPVQPSSKSGGYVQLTGGSFSTENADVILQTGKIDGWEPVIAGGGGRANGFRTAPDGFAWPSRNYAGFFKTRKVFSRGDVSFGAYLGGGHGWRPTPLPVTPVPGLSVNGAGQPGPLLSEQTTGYYSTVNENVWEKNDFNRAWLVYARQNIRLDSRVTLHNQLWYRRGDRLHIHYNNFGGGTPTNLYEHNNPFSTQYGDKIWSDIYLPYNQVGVGGYFINAVYNSRNSFYNPAVCATTTSQITYGIGNVIPSGTTVCGSAAVPNDNHRSNLWYVTDLAAFIQDAFTPIASLTITPGFRAVSFHTDYYPYGGTYFAEADALGTPTTTDGYTQNPTGAGLFGGVDQGRLPATQTNFDKTEPSLAARWQALHWLGVYGNWSTAYRLPTVGGGGGLYQKTPAVGNLLEKGVEYQFGGKAFWPEIGSFSKVLLNVNYYHLDFSNEFIGVSLANGVFKGLGQGESIYHGVNVSAEANLGTLKMFTNLNVEKAYFSNYSFQGTDYSGLPVVNTPDKTFNIGAYWTHTIAGGIGLKPRAWYQYVGPQHVFDNFNGAPSTEEIPSYGVLNLALAATLPSAWYGNDVKSVKLKLEVMNALDRKYNQFGYISAGGLYQTGAADYLVVYPGAPRAVYGTISVRF